MKETRFFYVPDAETAAQLPDEEALPIIGVRYNAAQAFKKVEISSDSPFAVTMYLYVKYSVSAI